MSVYYVLDSIVYWRYEPVDLGQCSYRITAATLNGDVSSFLLFCVWKCCISP